MQNILTNSRKPDVTFYSTGRIEIASHVSKRLLLSSGDVLDIMIDKKECEVPEYYLYVKYRAHENIGRHAMTVFPTNRSGNHYRCSSIRHCKTILDICGVAGKARLYVGEPIDDPRYGMLLPLIMKCFL